MKNRKKANNYFIKLTDILLNVLKSKKKRIRELDRIGETLLNVEIINTEEKRKQLRFANDSSW